MLTSKLVELSSSLCLHLYSLHRPSIPPRDGCGSSNTLEDTPGPCCQGAAISWKEIRGGADRE